MKLGLRTLPLPFASPVLCAPVILPMPLLPSWPLWWPSKASKCRKPAHRPRLARLCAPESRFVILDVWTAGCDGAGMPARRRARVRKYKARGRHK